MEILSGHFIKLELLCEQFLQGVYQYNQTDISAPGVAYLASGITPSSMYSSGKSAAFLAHISSQKMTKMHGKLTAFHSLVANSQTTCLPDPRHRLPN